MNVVPNAPLGEETKVMPGKSDVRMLIEKAFRENGLPAALAVGAEHKVKTSRVNRWVKKMGGQASEPKAKKTNGVVATTAVDPLTKYGPNHRRVTAFGRKFVCLLLNEGPEQSEVKFPNGNVRFVINTWLKPLDAPDDPLEEKQDVKVETKEPKYNREALDRRAKRGNADNEGKERVPNPSKRVLRRDGPVATKPARRGGSSSKGSKGKGKVKKTK